MSLSDSSPILGADTGAIQPIEQFFSVTAVFDTLRLPGVDGVIDFQDQKPDTCEGETDGNREEAEMSKALKLLPNRPSHEESSKRRNTGDKKKGKDELTWRNAVIVVTPLRARVLMSLETRNGIIRALRNRMSGRTPQEFTDIVGRWVAVKIGELLVEDGYISEIQKPYIQVSQNIIH
jgi:hypothetical protein